MLLLSQKTSLDHATVWVTLDQSPIGSSKGHGLEKWVPPCVVLDKGSLLP